ncbi:uncharacterized mitochondrial protein AtMg00810-like [Argentina anserina]|uniref:uncharacterized mitochondrial protein AtMg00810-like n=1 Tax=Argentina anserina TaxID=57926 RepID=UPI0021766FA9|nr:uncharacterized mitochondrial protein AtMg00810-like [Potentilla anserina]
MNDELKALHDNQTWSVVPLPKGHKVVGARWIYKTKFHSDGTIERHKARLVARGFTQIFGVDYKETFAHVAKMNIVRVLLSVVVNSGWNLFQMDVKKMLFCMVTWRKMWFKRSHGNSSMFVRNGKMGRLIVLVYVDDLIIIGDSDSEIQALKKSLHSTFAIKDLGRLRYFLGIEMDQTPGQLFLNQRKYISDFLHEVGMQDTKIAHSPLPSNLNLDTESESLPDIAHYQRLVGKLIYLTITRPDITHAVRLVSQFMHSPHSYHLQLVKRILRYLKGSMTKGIFMKKHSHFKHEGYTDLDWAGNVLDRKFTTGFCTFVGGNLVTWKSKKQSVVARSSAEAEYRAMALAACELIWLKTLLSDLGIIVSTPIILHCDNQAAMHIAANPVFHKKTKHIEVDCHFIRNQVQSKLLSTAYIKSSEQLADVFTKILPTTQFGHLLFKLGSRDSLDLV